MKDKRILIPGGGGSIGSELVRQLSKDNKVYILDNNESGLFDICQETGASGRVGDIRDDRTVRDVFSDFKPQVVINAAAYKHVPLMEQFPLEAIQVNVLGTYNLIYYAGVYAVEKFVQISSDKAVNATSVMGQTKRLSETIAVNMGYTAVRFGNVWNSRGSVATIWQRQIANNEPLTVTDERMTRYVMSIEEAVGLVIEAAENAEAGQTWILDMGEPKSIMNLAAWEIEKSGKDLEIQIIGVRPGEVLEERLMSQEEEKRAIKKDRFWII